MECQNSGKRNNKPGMVKRRTTNLWYGKKRIIFILISIFQYKSDRLLLFTPVGGFSNRYWYEQGNYFSHNVLFEFFVSFIHHLYCYHIYTIIYVFICYILVINIFHTLYIICINYIFLFPAKIFHVQFLPLILYNYYFLLQIPSRLYFLPVLSLLVIFSYLMLINSTLPFLHNYSVLYLFRIQE